MFFFFFLKIRARVLDLGLDECFGPKISFYAPDPKFEVAFKIYNFINLNLRFLIN